MTLTDSERSSPPRVQMGGRSRTRRVLGGGTNGNEQLTAITGVLLLVLFAVLGITILMLSKLLWLHLFLGVLLIGPVALKLASTGYRFARYYTGNRAYIRKGPPPPLMRMLGPLVILTTVGVFLTGVLLLVDGPGAPALLRTLHKLTFIAWLGAMGLHVLGHLPELPRALSAVSRAERRERRLLVRGLREPEVSTPSALRASPGSWGRMLVIVAAIAAGVVLALLFLPQIHAWTSGGLFDPRYFHSLGDG